jgi:predicted glycosyltransferase
MAGADHVVSSSSAEQATNGDRGTTTDPLSIAYYCTGHGLGHATRSIEVCKHLLGRGHTVTVVTGAPARVFLQEVRGAAALQHLQEARLGVQATAAAVALIQLKSTRSSLVAGSCMLRASSHYLELNHTSTSSSMSVHANS